MGEPQAVVNLSVTADRIARGVPDDTSRCPIALAVKESVPGIKPETVSVSNYYVAWSDNDGESWCADMPPEGRAFVEAFDDREPVNPLEIVLSPAPHGGADDAEGAAPDA